MQWFLWKLPFEVQLMVRRVFFAFTQLKTSIKDKMASAENSCLEVYSEKGHEGYANSLHQTWIDNKLWPKVVTPEKLSFDFMIVMCSFGQNMPSGEVSDRLFGDDLREVKSLLRN